MSRLGVRILRIGGHHWVDRSLTDQAWKVGSSIWAHPCARADIACPFEASVTGGDWAFGGTKVSQMQQFPEEGFTYQIL